MRRSENLRGERLVVQQGHHDECERLFEFLRTGAEQADDEKLGLEVED